MKKWMRHTFSFTYVQCMIFMWVSNVMRCQVHGLGANLLKEAKLASYGQDDCLHWAFSGVRLLYEQRACRWSDSKISSSIMNFNLSKKEKSLSELLYVLKWAFYGWNKHLKPRARLRQRSNPSLRHKTNVPLLHSLSIIWGKERLSTSFMANLVIGKDIEIHL